MRTPPPVRDAYYAFAGSTAPNLWLMLGDNAYNGGTDTEYQAAVFDMYPATLRQSVLWPTIGNHDVANTAQGTGPVLRHLYPAEERAGRRAGVRHRGVLLVRLRATCISSAWTRSTST